jgi:predicted DNA-binding transcriptional regulator YafY
VLLSSFRLAAAENRTNEGDLVKRFEAVSRLHRLLTAKHQPPMPLRRICDELECSESTAKRCIRDLRERFAHPIEYDGELGGYYYDRSAPMQGWELPGLWFNESELTALVSMRALLADVHPGIFESEIAPLGERIDTLLEEAGIARDVAAERLRVLSMGRRPVGDLVLRLCADAVLARRRLSFTYYARSNGGEAVEREVSPQRLVHYRDNWYLDAWCHLRDGLRIFSLDCIRDPHQIDEAADEVDGETLDRTLGTSYGIFAGESDRVAVLRFSPDRARWVAKEVWHPNQDGRYLEDGAWELRVPYSRAEELVMDVLRYGSDVEVVEPVELRHDVAGKLREAAAKYGDVSHEDGSQEIA